MFISHSTLQIDFRPHCHVPTPLAWEDSESRVLRPNAQDCRPLGHCLHHYLLPAAFWSEGPSWSHPGRVEQNNGGHPAMLCHLQCEESTCQEILWWLQEKVLAFCKSCVFSFCLLLFALALSVVVVLPVLVLCLHFCVVLVVFLLFCCLIYLFFFDKGLQLKASTHVLLRFRMVFQYDVCCVLSLMHTDILKFLTVIFRICVAQIV